MAYKNTPNNSIIEQIHHAGSQELDEIVAAVRQRYHELFPEWEVLMLSLPRNNPAERKKCLNETISMLKKYDVL